eukprot:6196269-Prymnesium_polylepis.1
MASRSPSTAGASAGPRWQSEVRHIALVSEVCVGVACRKHIAMQACHPPKHGACKAERLNDAPRDGAVAHVFGRISPPFICVSDAEAFTYEQRECNSASFLLVIYVLGCAVFRR